MASTFSMNTSNSYEGRYMNIYCRQEKNIASNKNTIYWTLTVTGGSSKYYSTGPTSVYIAGQRVYYSDRKEWSTYSFPAAAGTVSGSLEVSAANNGSCSVGVSITTGIWYDATTTTSNTWYLDDIPRAATLNSAPHFTPDDKPTITYTNPAGSAANPQISIHDVNGSVAYVGYRSVPATGSSYTFNFTEAERQKLMDAVPKGTDTMSVRYYLKTLINGSMVGSFSYLTRTLTVKRPATITVAPNFTDEDNPSITINNPGGETVDDIQVGILANDGATQLVRYRSVPVTDTSYTFELTDEEREALIGAIPNGVDNVSVRFYIKTYKDGSIIEDPKYLTRTLTVINADPELTYGLTDIGAASTNLTNDPNIIIKGFNYVEASMTPNLKKGATINKHSITNGDQLIDNISGAFNNVESDTFWFSLTDSFGHTVNEPATMTMVSYVKLTCDLKANNPTADGEIAFKISGNYFNDKFGENGVDNELTVKWRIKENNNEYGEWIDVVPVITDNTYAITVNVTGLNYRSAYTVQAIAMDKINNSGIPSVEQRVKAIPVYNWGENNFDINVPLYVDEINSKDVNTENIDSTHVKTDKLTTDKIVCNNVFNGNLELGSWDSNTGIEQENTQCYRNVDPVEVIANETYKFYVNGRSQRIVVLFYDDTNTFLSETRDVQGDGIFTTPGNTKYINFRCFQSEFTEDYENLVIEILPASPIKMRTVNGQSIVGSGDLEVGPSPSLAQMFTSQRATYGGEAQVIYWLTSNNIEIGDFVCEPANYRIRIPKGTAEYVRIYGSIAGQQYISASLRLTDEDGNYIREIFNHQPQGNLYFNMPAFNRVCKLDTTKDYYVSLYIAGYNGKDFYMNNGYGNSATFIGAEKIAGPNKVATSYINGDEVNY